MKFFILILLFVHTTTATIDLQNLKETATTKLQKITDTASSSLQQFADTIDFDKVQKLDVLNILPKLQYKGKLIKDTYDSIPEYSQKVKMYLESIKGLIKKDMKMAFEAPWPVVKRVVIIHHDDYYS